MLLIAGCGTVERSPVPDASTPVGPLDLERPVGRATGRQLLALKNDPDRCRATLAASRLQVRALENRRNGAFCHYSDVVQILRSTVPYSGPVHLTCPMAAALYLWERDIVAPAAVKYLSSRLVRIDHMGTYSCRRRQGGSSNRPSEHATANAIDVSGFRLEDGRRVTVLGDWSQGTTAERAFLREIRDRACGLFQVVLSPDYNAAHRDHFHLDMGDWGVCR
ncbi:Uncharacterized conserved protein [Thalassobaculum litoreum DSM 18839]|uniref:Uncharacterized conserved protein n=1 Tax=Thalassobaculum litoreum DSM 18839 TaxID=1123362 RepID=A0A8G2BL15_9PROT|nr:Uncharacterized conserved protein [Thalassobaculum litoreum DSM 18839]